MAGRRGEMKKSRYINRPEVKASKDFEKRMQPFADELYQSRKWEMDRSQDDKEKDGYLLVPNGGFGEPIPYANEEKFYGEGNYPDILIEAWQDIEIMEPGWGHPQGKCTAAYLANFWCYEHQPPIVEAWLILWGKFKKWLWTEYIKGYKVTRYLIYPKGYGLTGNILVPKADVPTELYQILRAEQPIPGFHYFVPDMGR
jgi:hypothetical protein